LRLRCDDRQPHRELAASAGAGAAGLDFPSMQLYQPFDERQAEAEELRQLHRRLQRSLTALLGLHDVGKLLMSASDLDAVGRPRSYADQLVHHGCPRNEFYEFKASAEKPSDLGCLMENMGCKATQAHGDCNVRLWNGSGSCLRGGYACINCTAPGFEEPGHPFAQTPKIAGIPLALPNDMPKAWFMALAALSKSATPRRVRENAVADHTVVAPAIRKAGRR
jgi:hypothetical protein